MLALVLVVVAVSVSAYCIVQGAWRRFGGATQCRSRRADDALLSFASAVRNGEAERVKQQQAAGAAREPRRSSLQYDRAPVTEAASLVYAAPPGTDAPLPGTDAAEYDAPPLVAKLSGSTLPNSPALFDCECLLVLLLVRPSTSETLIPRARARLRHAAINSVSEMMSVRDAPVVIPIAKEFRNHDDEEEEEEEPSD